MKLLMCDAKSFSAASDNDGTSSAPCGQEYPVVSAPITRVFNLAPVAD